MKRILIVTVALLLALSMLAGCGKASDASSGKKEKDSGTSEQTSGVTGIEDIKTMADVFALESAEYITSSSTDNKYAYGFLFDGVYYRAVVTMSDETAEEYYAIDRTQDDYEEKETKLFSVLTVDAVENLTEKIPSEEELSKYVGKTGEDLLNEGWTGNYYNFEQMECEMNYGVFTYKICFAGEVDLPEDYDADEVLKPLTVTSVDFETLGDVSADF